MANTDDSNYEYSSLINNENETQIIDSNDDNISDSFEPEDRSEKLIFINFKLIINLYYE